MLFLGELSIKFYVSWIIFFLFFQKPESNVFRDLELRNDEVGL